MEKAQLLNRATHIIHQSIPDLIGVYLFGSFANQSHTNKSDLDIAILARNKIDPTILWNIAQTIAIDIKKDVDLIDLATASTVFQAEIIYEGVKIETQDPEACDSFEDIVFAKYVRLNDLREEIIKDIQARGSVH